MQIVNMYRCRSPTGSVVSAGLSGNPLIVSDVALEIVLMLIIDYARWGHAIPGTLLPVCNAWFVVIPLSAAPVFVEESCKGFARRTLNRRARYWSHRV